MITIDDITIKIRMLNRPWLLAQATVIFSDIIETKGWKILRSTKMHERFQEEIWIQAPSFSKGAINGKEVWDEIIWINDRRLYEQIEEKIYNAFFAKRNKENGEQGVAEARKQKEEIDVPVNLEDIDIDKIPL
ncbi:MAG: hypothetical protein KatS3mg101_0096 [Patescibacteria group bacterium]|nr:MAG: hypothetical protein KatS3mg101_0096 [Patescibacteria group bacterium]